MSTSHQQWLQGQPHGDTQPMNSSAVTDAADATAAPVTTTEPVSGPTDAQPLRPTDSAGLQLFSLRAANLLALQTLCCLQESLSTQPIDARFHHTAQFVHDLPPQSARAVLGADERDSSPPSASFSESSPPSASFSESSSPPASDAVVRCVEFAVTLGLPPRYKALGWTLGSDPSEADLVLPDRASCASRHIAIAFNENGQVMLRALRHGVAVDAIKVTKGADRLLGKRSHVIKIRNLEFAWNSTRAKEHEPSFMKALREYGEHVGIRPHHALAATPQEHPHFIGPYQLSENVGFGGIQYAAEGRTVVSAASHSTSGRAFAVKTWKRADQPGCVGAREEVSRYRAISNAMSPSRGAHDFILRLHEVIGDPEDDSRRTPIHLIFSPLADGDLHHCAAHLSLDASYTIVVQTLMGLEWLHARGWVHRDIKPGNIGVLKHGPRAVILDLGQAVHIASSELRGCQHTPGRGGTVGYLAPEQENAQYCDPRVSPPVYDYKVDIFAVGTIGIDLLSSRSSWAASDQEQNRKTYAWPRSPNPFGLKADGHALHQYNEVMRRLNDFSQESTPNWLAGMLQTYAQNRPSAVECLRHPAVQRFVQQEREHWNRQEVRDAVPGSKRVQHFASNSPNPAKR